MTHVTLEQAKKLSAVTCPTCRGNGRVEMLEHCTTCNGKGTLAYQGEWPQLVWAYRPVDGWRLVWLKNETDWHMDHRIPAPHPVDALLWLESIGAAWVGRTSARWYAQDMDVYADTPSALLDAVLEAL